jgi:hypothetical protein
VAHAAPQTFVPSRLRVNPTRANSSLSLSVDFGVIPWPTPRAKPSSLRVFVLNPTRANSSLSLSVDFRVIPWPTPRAKPSSLRVFVLTPRGMTV